MFTDIKGFEGYYQINELGEVRSLDRKVRCGRGAFRMAKGRILRPNTGTNGYLYVVLSKNSKEKTVYIHRLVGETFICNPNNLPEINHINGIKTDNRLCNLEWLDHFTNASIANLGRHKDNSMEKNPKAKKLICKTTGEEFGCIKEFAIKYNINYSTIKAKIQNGIRTFNDYEIIIA